MPEENDSEITPKTVVSTMVRPTGKYSLVIGDMLGSYRIRKPLGHGGMGQVYLALHTTLNVLRAVKVLPADSSNAKAKKYGERFLQEARMAISLEHPNIISIFDADYDSVHDVYYIVMEYVDGGSIRTALKTMGPYPEKKALLIALKTAEALSAAEKRGLVHRDIKPDNIMLKRNGSVKVADFGIAKTSFMFMNPDDNSEKVSMTGTPAYMSPEQVMNPDSVDRRADIYSLGVTLYEMLTGVRPYTGEQTVDILKSAFRHSVPDPRKKNPNISKAAAGLVMRMMSKKREDRPQNAEEVIRELQEILGNGLPETGTQTSGTETRNGTEQKNGELRFRTPWKERIDDIVENHWLLAGITAGITFFLLTGLTAAGVYYGFRSGFFLK